MNIMRETLLMEKREDLVELIDKLDTRVIDYFLSLGVPYAEETRELLMLQFNENICEDINIIAKRRPEFMEYGHLLVSKLSMENKTFDHELCAKFVTLITQLASEDLEAALCLEKCLTYYTSFFRESIE